MEKIKMIRVTEKVKGDDGFFVRLYNTWINPQKIVAIVKLREGTWIDFGNENTDSGMLVWEAPEQIIEAINDESLVVKIIGGIPKDQESKEFPVDLFGLIGSNKEIECLADLKDKKTFLVKGKITGIYLCGDDAHYIYIADNEGKEQAYYVTEDCLRNLLKYD